MKLKYKMIKKNKAQKIWAEKVNKSNWGIVKMLISLKGIEPLILKLWASRFNQLNYKPINQAHLFATHKQNQSLK